MKLFASLVLLSFIVGGLSLSGCINGGSDQPTTTTTVGCIGADCAGSAMSDAEFEGFLTKYKQRQMYSANGTSIPDRGVYGLPGEIFADLPPFPNDFLYKTYLIKVGRFFDIGSLDERYWKQPEFDPDFTRYGLKYWNDLKSKDYKKTHWSTSGMRTYPFEQYVEAAPGYSFNISVIMSTDWSVEAYQGIHIKTLFINSTVSADGKKIAASEGAERYINVNVTPDEFLLTPAFPIFTYDWNRKLLFTGKISEDTPAGTYILSFDLIPPSQANSEKWFMEHLNLYSDGVQMVKADKPYLQAIIHVR